MLQFANAPFDKCDVFFADHLWKQHKILECFFQFFFGWVNVFVSKRSRNLLGAALGVFNGADVSLKNDFSFSSFRCFDKVREFPGGADFVVFFLKFSGIMSILSKETNNDSRALKIYDSFIFPMSKIFDKMGFSKIVGKNLILVAKKKTF